MNKTFAHCVQMIVIVWLIVSPLVYQNVDARNVLRNNTKRTTEQLIASAPLLSACTPFQQLSIAIMLDIDITLDLHSFGFCQQVIDILRTCQRSEWMSVATSLQLTAVVDIAVKFKAMVGVYPLLTNVIGSFSGITDNSCDDVFHHVYTVAPVLVTILDIRVHAQLNALFTKYGCPCTPAFVNLCLSIQISVFFNAQFTSLCNSLFVQLHVTLNAHVYPVINNCLLTLSVHFNLVFQSVLYLGGGSIGLSPPQLPCLTDVIPVIHPNWQYQSLTSQFNYIWPSTCRSYGVPYGALRPAQCVFDLISLC